MSLLNRKYSYQRQRANRGYIFAAPTPRQAFRWFDLKEKKWVHQFTIYVDGEGTASEALAFVERTTQLVPDPTIEEKIRRGDFPGHSFGRKVLGGGSVRRQGDTGMSTYSTRGGLFRDRVHQ